MKTHLPKEIIIHILEFDNSYKQHYELCMIELRSLYLLHNQILLTYNNVHDTNKYLFRSFSVHYHRFVLTRLKRCHHNIYDDSKKQVGTIQSA